MTAASLSSRIARVPFVGTRLAAVARSVWRPLFNFYCGWNCFDVLQERARLVLQSPDWHRIPRVPSAGRIRGMRQVMHNGLRVRIGCYYGWGCVPFFWRTAGIHEPQEEIAFAAVLPLLPPGAVMLELGSYWGFYSMWFAQQVPSARNFLVEPNERGLEIGRQHFADNGLNGHFIRAFVGATPASGDGGVPTITVDAFRREHDIARLHVLHADIQGHELEMLRGARETLAEGAVDYLFLSTHGEALHAACRDHLRQCPHLRVILDVSPAQSYSDDGLLLAARVGLPIPEIRVALR
jgi:hypothetical protein